MPSFPRSCRPCLLFLHPLLDHVSGEPPPRWEGVFQLELEAEGEGRNPCHSHSHSSVVREALADVSIPTPLPPLPASQPHGVQCRVRAPPLSRVPASLSQQALHPLGLCPSSQPPPTPPLNLSSHPPYSCIPPYSQPGYGCFLKPNPSAKDTDLCLEKQIHE